MKRAWDKELLRNILTFDVEDWHQSTFDHDLPVTARVCENTIRILEILEPAGVRATFFVLGLVVLRCRGLR